MTQVTVMVTLTYPGNPPDPIGQEMLGEQIEGLLVKELERGSFPGCSQIEAVAEEDE